MSKRTIASRVRSSAAIALPVVAAVLAFAPAAGAATFNATTTTQLVNDIGTANSTGGSNTIILSAATNYAPTTPLSVTSGDFLEITGPPQPSPSPTALASSTELNGTAETNHQANFITVAAGADLILKSVNVTATTSTATNNWAVEDQGYFEGDNVAFQGNIGGGVQANTVTTTAKVVLNDVSITDNVAQSDPAIQGLAGGQPENIQLNNVTIANNTGGGLSGSGFTMNNTLLANNDTGVVGNLDCFETTTGQVTSTNSMDDDGSCAAISSGTTTGSNVNAGNTQFNGGPVSTVKIDSTSSAYNVGGGCLPGDERFFVQPSTGATCSIGSYQVNGAADTTAPRCTIQSINESSNPSVASTEVVNATDAGTGLGPDAISGATTTNGTVSWPTISGTPFDMTSPSLTQDSDAPSTGNFPVTATKPVGDLTAGDTKWSFTATSWAGISTLCK